MRCGAPPAAQSSARHVRPGASMGSEWMATFTSAQIVQACRWNEHGNRPFRFAGVQLDRTPEVDWIIGADKQQQAGEIDHQFDTALDRADAHSPGVVLLARQLAQFPFQDGFVINATSIMLSDHFASAAQRSDPSSTDWIMAAASVLTFAVALAAALYARAQVSEGKQARKQAASLEVERSQPNVVMYTEPSSASQVLVDLVIKNYGLTAAFDVRTDLEPALERTGRAGGVAEVVAVPEVIPFLAPGQEWRTLWDNGLARKDSGLPDRHEGFIRYRGIEGAERESPVVLDWSIYKTRRWVELRTVHHAAKALEEIQRNQKKWNESIHGGLNVVVRSGHRADAETARYWAEQETQDERHRALLDEERERAESDLDL